MENPSDTWNSANVQLQHGVPKEYPKFFGICWTQHNPQNTEAALKSHDNKKIWHKEHPKKPHSNPKNFLLGILGWSHPAPRFHPSLNKHGFGAKSTWKSMEKTRCGKFLFPSEQSSSDLGVRNNSRSSKRILFIPRK